MKSIVLRAAFSVFAMVALAGVAAAQDMSDAIRENPKYGATPEERVENVKVYSFYRDAYRNKDYDRALGYLPDLLAKAPKIGDNLYIFGMNMYKHKIALATSLQQKSMYIDSLMLLYDMRMEHFGDHPERGRKYIAVRKAQDFLAYKPTDREGVRKCCKEAVDLNGESIDPGFVLLYFNELVSDYKNADIETEPLLTEYQRLAKFLDTDVTPEKEEAKKTLDALFISSGAANCDNLETIYKPKFAANPQDTAMLQQALSLMIKNKCASDFQIQLAEAYYKLKPSSGTAMMLASTFEERNDPEMARKYLTEAINVEKDGPTRANLAVRIAATELTSNNARAAADFARQAIDINPQNGYAYMILAQAYAAGSSQCADFDRQTVYWLVSDLLAKARPMLSGDHATIETIDKLMASYRGFFPSNEECFFRGLDNGAPYTVNCGWVSGRTTVRTR